MYHPNLTMKNPLSLPIYVDEVLIYLAHYEKTSPMTPPTTLKKAKLRTKQEEETNSYNISGTVG
jgi:hypothetical protein